MSKDAWVFVMSATKSSSGSRTSAMVSLALLLHFSGYTQDGSDAILTLQRPRSRSRSSLAHA